MGGNCVLLHMYVEREGGRVCVCDVCGVCVLCVCVLWVSVYTEHIPPFCVSENLNTCYALLLDYILAFYPMLLIFITYILIKLHGYNLKPLVMLWQPFHKCFVRTIQTWDPHASIMNTFVQSPSSISQTGCVLAVVMLDCDTWK